MEFKFCLSHYDFYQILNRECGVLVRKSFNDGKPHIYFALLW